MLREDLLGDLGGVGYLGSDQLGREELCTDLGSSGDQDRRNVSYDTQAGLIFWVHRDHLGSELEHESIDLLGCPVARFSCDGDREEVALICAWRRRKLCSHQVSLQVV